MLNLLSNNVPIAPFVADTLCNYSIMHFSICTESVNYSDRLKITNLTAKCSRNIILINQKSFNKKNFKSVGMTLAKVKEQDGMTLAKVKEQDGMTVTKVRHAQVSHAPY